ncbi:unnamed protein product [Dovyalis caffra]|uniref:BZIP domain-containing protein n=1 Tax=Dovyalis caffra TaxID=77055 RepID=A0AAV1RK06_9ROSI|nr:unnamed protein product [Dovyalis caffra]
MEFLDFSDAEISPGTVYVENSLTNPLFPNQLAEPGVGETTLDLGTGIDVRNYCGLEDHQRHQQQSVTPDQPGPKSNAFPTGTCHAVHHELRNSLKHQQESAPMEGTMNVNNISMNHQAVLEQPAVDLKKLAKQRNDLRYRQRKKEETKDLKRKVDELMEREKHLANENDSLKKDGARMEKALKQSKRDVHQLKEKNDGLSTTVTEISRGLASALL